jgi:hypothetical protein
VSEQIKTPKRKIRTLAVRPPQTALAQSNEALLHMYDSTLTMLQEGIRKGATNYPLGIMAFMSYVDFLHGGAYTRPTSELPYFMKDPTKSPYYNANLVNFGISEGLLGWLISIFGTFNPTELVKEVMMNANVPHVFPKLISDEHYALLKATFAYWATLDAFQKTSTGVSTFVEGMASSFKTATEGVKNLEQAASDAAKVTAENVDKLLPLLSLLTV